MVRDAEQVRGRPTRSNKERIEAQATKLENYAFSIANAVNEAVAAGSLDENDRKTVYAAIDKMSQWLQTGQEATKAEYENQQRMLEAMCAPTMRKMYAQSAAAADAGAKTSKRR